jgi:hypothetical protein
VTLFMIFIFFLALALAADLVPRGWLKVRAWVVHSCVRSHTLLFIHSVSVSLSLSLSLSPRRQLQRLGLSFLEPQRVPGATRDQYSRLAAPPVVRACVLVCA